jgi:hypothetical protein
MREALALRLMNDAGVPSQRARYVRLYQNGARVSLFSRPVLDTAHVAVATGT